MKEESYQSSLSSWGHRHEASVVMYCQPFLDNYSNGFNVFRVQVNKLFDLIEKPCKVVTVEFETRRLVETPNRRGKM